MRPRTWRWIALGLAVVGIAFVIASLQARTDGAREFASCEATATVPLGCMFVGAFAGMGEAAAAMLFLILAALALASSYWLERRERGRAGAPPRDRAALEREIAAVEEELARVEAALAEWEDPT